MRPLREFLRLNALHHPDRVAVVDEFRSITYAQLAERAYAVGTGLREQGITPGQTVGVLAGNTIFFAEAYLGALCAGAIPVLYNWRWATPELVFGINDSDAEVVLIDRDWAAHYLKAEATGELTGVRRAFIEDVDYESLLVASGPPDYSEDLSTVNVICYTGGTTGFPKGVMISERSIINNGFNEIIDTDMQRDDVTLHITPLFHAAALLCWFVPHLMLGARNVMIRQFDERKVGEVVEAQGVTNGFLVPNMVRRLAAAGAFTDWDWSSYRRMYVGGAALRMKDKLAVRDALPHAALYHQYGLSEGGPIVTRLRPEDMFREDLDGSMGREFLMIEAEVRDPGTGRVMAPGEVGELVTRGPNTMLGYYKREVETADALDADGWLHTGDMVSRNEEGYFFHQDRGKDMIKTGGENVYSSEVERVLYSHPDVNEVAVIGVPSEKWDEEVCAVVVRKPSREVTEQELREHCRASLAGYKIPKQIIFVSTAQIPYNDSGKILKRALKELRLFGE